MERTAPSSGRIARPARLSAGVEEAAETPRRGEELGEVAICISPQKVSRPARKAGRARNIGMRRTVCM